MKLYSISLIIFSLLLTSCGQVEPISVKKSFQTFTVRDGNLSVTDTIIAPIEGRSTSELSFKSSGRVGNIYARPGDRVKKGQILAELTNQEGVITYNGLGNVAENIGAMARSTLTMRNNTTQLRLATSKLYDERIKQATTGIDTLEISLEQAKKNLSNQASTLDSNYHLHVNAFLKLADSMIYEGDRILGITTNFEYSNDAWDPYLGLRLGNIKAEAHTAWGRLYTARGELLAKREKNIVITPLNAEAELKILGDAYSELGNLSMKMGSTLENSMIGGDLSEERLNGWIAEWSTFKSGEQAAESQFSLWRDHAISLITTASGGSSVASMDITNLSTRIENARKNIDVLKAEKEGKLREIGVSLSEIDGKSAELDMQLSQTMMNQFLAGETMDGIRIYAPYDGVILEKHFDIGNMIQAGSSLFRITSIDMPIIKTYIDNYTYNYEPGDILTLRNTYSRKVFTGSIALIQDEKDPLHNKNYTEIRIQGYSGSLGERMDIELSHKKKALENGAIIPLSSIITRYGPTGVFILDSNNVVHFTMVELLSSDMHYAEVLGLPRGSKVITDGKENMIDGEVLAG